jgi:hypothetical protein
LAHDGPRFAVPTFDHAALHLTTRSLPERYGTDDEVMVTLPVDFVEAIRRLVADGKADSVSRFVQHAAHVWLNDVAGWGALLGQALADTGGSDDRPGTTMGRSGAGRVRFGRNAA